MPPSPSELDPSAAAAGSLPYRYEFGADQLADVIGCYREHGFAVVRQMAAPDVIADLREAVNEVLGAGEPLAPGDNRTTPQFVEHSPCATRLLDAAPYLELCRRMFDSDALTIHRSFAVLKNEGSAPVAWHRDFHHAVADAPRDPDAVLDQGDHGFRALWYLDGSYPDAGGLWLIPDSHRPDWEGLPGFVFTEGRKSFFRIGEPARDHAQFDMPQMLPLRVDPGDLVIYSLRLYHGAAAQPHGVRRACAVILRPTWPVLEVPWPQTDAARRLISSIPEHLQSFVTNYVGIDYGWTPPPAR